MKSKAPFKKPPPSQHRKPEFYWRGGDAFREQEYITDEYKKALTEFRLAEQELRQVENEVAQASNTLNEREGYTTALAGFLDGDTDGFTEENQLKQQLFQLEADIHHEEAELEKRQAVHNPAVASGLQKEKAFYMIEIQRGTKSICLASEESTRAREQLAACTVNARYRHAQQLEYQLDKLQRKKKYLRSLVTKTKYEFDQMKPITPLTTNEARTERIAYQEMIELKTTIGRAQEKKQRRPQKHENYLNFLIDQIEELNVRLSEIGLDEEIVDTDPIRERYFGSDGNGEEEEGEGADANNNDNNDNTNENNENADNNASNDSQEPKKVEAE